MARPMTAYLAVGILDGFEEPEGPEEIVAASRWIRDKGPRGVLNGSGTSRAIELADTADKLGDDLEALEACGYRVA